MNKPKLYIRIGHRFIVESAPIADDMRLRDRYSHPDCSIVCYRAHGVKMNEARRYELDRVVMLAIQNAGLSVAALRYAKKKAKRTSGPKQDIEAQKRTLNMFDEGDA